MFLNTIYAPQEKQGIKPVISGGGNSLPGGMKVPKRKNDRKERRKATRDRRQSVRDGIIVSLSTKKDRRKKRDRRRFHVSV